MDTETEIEKDQQLAIGAQFRQWKLTKKLGEGSFGSVYQVKHIAKKDEYAMKVESMSEEDSMIKMEVAVLKTFRNSARPHPHVCDYIDSGVTTHHRFVVMKLAGRNLGDVRKQCPNGRFSEITTLRIGIQCIESIRALHDVGFIHRDIKPPNYAIGIGKEAKNLYILDYGLARQYINREGKLRAPRKGCGFRGTVRYASVNAHMRKDLGRHDDIWSLLYTLVECQKGRLPWRKISKKKCGFHYEKNTVADRLLDGMAREFHEMLNVLQGMQFQQRPDYDLFVRLLNDAIDRQKYKRDGPFDWEEHDETIRNSSIRHPFGKRKFVKEKGEEQKSHVSERK